MNIEYLIVSDRIKDILIKEGYEYTDNLRVDMSIEDMKYLKGIRYLSADISCICRKESSWKPSSADLWTELMPSRMIIPKVQTLSELFGDTDREG